MVRILLVALLGVMFLHPFGCRATHIVGGNFEMNAMGRTPGKYQIRLVLYFDEKNGSPGALDQSVNIDIFRKSDGYRMLSFTMSLTAKRPVVYANVACATLRSLETTELVYEKEMNVDPDLYDSASGYYMVWERCCRNSGIDNIIRPEAAGMVFYLEFPPMIRNKKPFLNSSPKFDILNGDYICANEPFRLNYDASDADGDELRYSLVTPYNGFSSTGDPRPVNQPSTSYPPITWRNNFDVTKQIAGNPPLQVDAGRGVISVTASTLGLHVFSVLCQEYRNGVLIGAIRRDFQLLVVDCPNIKPGTHSIVLKDTPTQSSVSFCEGTTTLLKSLNPNPDWNYQWQKDGDNILNATDTQLEVKESGQYLVVATLKKTCGKNTTSSNIINVRVTPKKVKIIADGIPTICLGSSIGLKTAFVNGYVYQWLINGKDLVGETKPTLSTNKPGIYTLKIWDGVTGCSATSDTVTVKNIVPPPLLPIETTRDTNAICPGDFAVLQVKNNTAYTYQWYFNNQKLTQETKNSVSATQEGEYYVVTSDTNYCASNSGTYDLLVIKNPPKITLDSVKIVCGLTANKVTLKGSPKGGVFSGVAVEKNTFDPMKAGYGRFKITYAVVRPQLSCLNGEASTWVKVTKPPLLNLAKETTLFNGTSVVLKGETKTIIKYEWSPPTGLDKTNIANPTATPSDTITYLLKATSDEDCVVFGKIHVNFLNKLFLPDIFTPNGDGINDVFEIKGTEFFPTMDIRIFDRWGSVVFYSIGYAKPFDGTYRGQALMNGTYAYKIIASDNYIVEGLVVIER